MLRSIPSPSCHWIAPGTDQILFGCRSATTAFIQVKLLQSECLYLTCEEARHALDVSTVSIQRNGTRAVFSDASGALFIVNPATDHCQKIDIENVPQPKVSFSKKSLTLCEAPFHILGLVELG